MLPAWPGLPSTAGSSQYWPSKCVRQPDSTQLVHQSTVTREGNSGHNFILQLQVGLASLTHQLTHTPHTSEAGSGQVLL